MSLQTCPICGRADKRACKPGAEADECARRMMFDQFGVTSMPDAATVAQNDLAELLTMLGMGDHARPQSPHEVFHEALGVLRSRLAEPDNDTLRNLGAFDRKCRIGKHQATNWVHLRQTIDALDAAGHSDAADTLIWVVWHEVNSVARAREYHRIALAESAEEARSWRSVAERLETEMQELLQACDCEIRDQTNNRTASDKQSAAYAEGALRVAKGMAARIREKSPVRG